jgi:hypothetical protein
MNTIKYTTGRTYDAPQVLEITIESLVTDEFGLQDLVATFRDASRHISGRIETVVFNDGIGQAVLEAYDAGRYTAV